MQKPAYSTKQALHRLIKFYITDNNIYRDVDKHFTLYNPIESYYKLKFIADKLDWLLTNRIHLFLNKRVLDIGCGSGEHAYMLQDYINTIDITDPNPVFMQLCKKIYTNSNQIRCVTEEQITSNTYDTIMTFGTLELIDNYQEWLQNIVDTYKFTNLIIRARPDTHKNLSYTYHDRNYRVDKKHVHTYTEHEKIINIVGVELLEYHISPTYYHKTYKQDNYTYIFKKL